MRIPEPDITITGLIDQAHEARTEKPRAHMGCSTLGHHCERWLWLSFRWAVQEQFKGRILRLFRRGQNEEAQIISDLRAIGMSVSGTQRRVNFGSHVSGSLDGIGKGVPGAPKTEHVLEFKTHSLKSFNDLEKNGVTKSKPQHWAQMQIYMAAFDLDDALYYAVCKDDDRIYTERVKRDAGASMQLFAKAQRIIAADRMPAPLSTDPTWFECKWCPAHDLCHGSKLTKQVSCRTCAHSTAERDGRWTCAHWEMDIPDTDAQRTGCDNHVLHPDLVPGWTYKPAETGVIWLTPHGEIHNAPEGHTSAEIAANWQACAANVKKDYAQWGAKVVA